ncbi:MAG: hypothetical protein ACKVU4_00095 [Phycisphaerales bacterium]
MKIAVGAWTDATGTTRTRHPEVTVRGDEAGLRWLTSRIDQVLKWSRDDPSFHTHILDGDSPGIVTEPPKVMVTIVRLNEPGGADDARGG